MKFPDDSPRTRARRLTTKFASSPVLPALGWTKLVEALVAGGPTLNWLAFSAAITVVWVFADEIREAADGLDDPLDSE